VIKNTFLVTTTKISLIHVLSPLDQQLSQNSEVLCSLKWKLRKLLVKRELYQKVQLAPLGNIQWLINCLNHSSVQAVCIDLELESEVIYLWADACHKSNKSIFIRLPSNPNLPKILYPLRWTLKTFIDRLVAALLIAFISPILILLALSVLLTSFGPIFSFQWRVGQRGRLFKAITFCTTIQEKQEFQSLENLHESQNLLTNSRMTKLGSWMHKHKLDLLPQLVNILQGEMSLVGPTALTVYEAKNINKKDRSYLRMLPGITSSSNSAESLNLLKINIDSHCKLSQLSNWSLWNDFKALIKLIQKAF
jgi:lipopolysaccharide/colanic/teichoic acid biosynthesis glycosyltransferase